MSEINSCSDMAMAVLAVAVKQAAAEDLRGCKWSREQVAEQLSAALQRNITIAQIDAVLSETHAHRFPLEWLPMWIRITGSRRLLELVCEASSLRVAEPTEMDLAEFARLSLRAEQMKQGLWGKV